MDRLPKATTPDPLLKRNDDSTYTREMNAFEAKERYALNVANTASVIRRRVIAELAKENGHSPKTQ